MTVASFVRIVLTLALAAGTLSAQARDVVDTAHVVEALKNGAIVWDVRDADAYAAGHIPGAVNIGHIGKALRDPSREDWLPVRELQSILGNAGIDLEKREVIVYDRKGEPLAYFGLSTLHYLGAANAKVYHGGLDDWKAAKRPLSTEPTRAAPVTLSLTPRLAGYVSTSEMVARVREGRSQIVDVRTPKEFSGDDVRAIRGGHVPGAVNVPLQQNWVDPATAAKLARNEVTTRDGAALKPEAELRKLYAALDPAKETIVYCQSGVRAAQAAAVLRMLGFENVKIYESSWLGYAGTLSAPVESESFVNVGALNDRIANLKGQVEELEAAVAALRK